MYALPFPGLFAVLQISESTSSKDVEGWDSLKHIIIVSVIEKHFNVKFALGEIESLKNIGEMVELIASKLAG